MVRTRNQAKKAQDSGTLPHLLNLPAEIQLYICELVLLHPEPIEITSIFPAQPALPRVCKALRPTALKTYYDGNTFQIIDILDLSDGAYVRAWLSHHADRKEVPDTRRIPLDANLDLTSPDLDSNGLCVLSSASAIGLVTRTWLDLLPGETVVLVRREVHPWQRMLLYPELPAQFWKACGCEIYIAFDEVYSKGRGRSRRADGRRLASALEGFLEENKETDGPRCEECGIVQPWKGTGW